MNSETPTIEKSPIPINKNQGPVLPNRASSEEDPPAETLINSKITAKITPIIIVSKLINNPPAAIFTSIRFLYFSSSSLYK